MEKNKAGRKRENGHCALARFPAGSLGLCLLKVPDGLGNIDQVVGYTLRVG